MTALVRDIAERSYDAVVAVGAGAWPPPDVGRAADAPSVPRTAPGIPSRHTEEEAQP
ncbi:hypothetical protein [Streptomyces sp. NRRL S-813]|uniref:hypothetical protein n=1 Tax=Streptomyces sp. NRRL S-813 TaxID=1463919 RepID=UPI00131DF366|nr:hypothetical protein [Streptomyces sp. NRRL S-813]